MVEHFTENEGVPSSSLGPGIGSESNSQRTCGRGSVVERLLAKEKATGSNPVARSENTAGRMACRIVMATWPSGKAEVCKTSITGSNPVVALV